MHVISVISMMFLLQKQLSFGFHAEAMAWAEVIAIRKRNVLLPKLSLKFSSVEEGRSY